MESKIKKLQSINEDIIVDIDGIDPLDTSIEEFTIGSKVKIKIQDLEIDRNIILDLLSKSREINESRDKKVAKIGEIRKIFTLMGII